MSPRLSTGCGPRPPDANPLKQHEGKNSGKLSQPKEFWQLTGQLTELWNQWMQFEFRSIVNIVKSSKIICNWQAWNGIPWESRKTTLHSHTFMERLINDRNKPMMVHIECQALGAWKLLVDKCSCSSNNRALH